MAMQLYLGRFDCDEATINKTQFETASSATPKSCEVYDEVTFNDQLALVTAYTAGEEPENYNYAKVVSNVGDAGGTKFYFIRNRIMAPAGKIIYILECDVLYTYMADIYLLPCVCRRASSLDGTPNSFQDPYIYDGKMPVRSYKSVDLYLTEKPENVTDTVDFNFDPNVYVIVTAG